MTTFGGNGRSLKTIVTFRIEEVSRKIDVREKPEIAPGTVYREHLVCREFHL